jgi:hypothetical protein
MDISAGFSTYSPNGNIFILISFPSSLDLAKYLIKAITEDLSRRNLPMKRIFYFIVRSPDTPETVEIQYGTLTKDIISDIYMLFFTEFRNKIISDQIFFYSFKDGMITVDDWNQKKKREIANSALTIFDTLFNVPVSFVPLIPLHRTYPFFSL